MGMNHLSFGYEASKLWVRIILALGTNHLNFGYESSGYETSVGTKRPVSLYSPQEKLKAVRIQNVWGANKVYYGRCVNGG